MPDPPYIRRDKKGDKHLIPQNLPNTNAYAADNKWMQDWVSKRTKQFDAFAPKQWDEEHYIKTIFTDPDKDDIRATSNKMKNTVIDNLKTVKYKDNTLVPGDAYVNANYGEYTPYGHYINFNTTPDKETIAHETGHASRLANIKPIRAHINKTLATDSKYKTKFDNYYHSPDEVYSRIWEFRRSLGLNPGDVVTPELIKKRREANPYGITDGSLYEHLDEPTIIKLMNELVSNKKSQKTSYAENGLTMKTKKAQYGLIQPFSFQQGKVDKFGNPIEDRPLRQSTTGPVAAGPLATSANEVPTNIKPLREKNKITKGLDRGIEPKEKGEGINWGHAAVGALSLADMLIPDPKIARQYVRPEENLSYNPYAYGTGSQAIAAHGVTLDDPKKVKAAPAGYVLDKDYKDTKFPNRTWYKKETAVSSGIRPANKPARPMVRSIGSPIRRKPSVSSASAIDRVYMEPDPIVAPVKTRAIMDEIVYGQRPVGKDNIGRAAAYELDTKFRNSQSITDPGLLNTAVQTARLRPINAQGMVDQDIIYDVPYDVFNKQNVSGGNRYVNTPAGDSTIQSYRVNSLSKLDKGGTLSAAKAKEMLKDGTANGKKLTKKQRGYFGLVASGKAKDGITVEELGYGGDFGENVRKVKFDKFGNPKKVKYFKPSGGNSMNVQDMFKDSLFEQQEAPQFDIYAQAPQMQMQQPMLPAMPVQQETYVDPTTIDYTGQLKGMDMARKGKTIYGADGATLQGLTKLEVEDNQVKPLSETTMQFSGPSHEDGGIQGRFAGQRFEAEGGEPLMIGEDGLTVFGKMRNPLTGKEFKQDAKALAKKELKVQKIVSKGIQLVNEADPSNKFQRLAFNAGNVMMMNGRKKEAELKDSKEHLGDLQRAMLEEGNYFRNGGYIPKYANGGGDDPREKFEKLKTKVEDALKMKYPNSKVEVRYNDLGKARDLATQVGVSKRNSTSPQLSAHNVDAARDYNIYIDGKLQGASSPLYKSVLHAEAKKMGLHSLNLKDDPYHISLVQEGGPNTFKKIKEIFPGVVDTPGYQEIAQAAKAGRLSPKQLSKYNQMLSVRESYPTTDSPEENLQMLSNQQIVGESVFNRAANNYLGIKPLTDEERQKLNMPPATEKPVGMKGDMTPPDLKQPEPWEIPSLAEPLGFNQILPEIYTAATNRVEPVQMQKYNPELYSPYQVSLQDRRNRNTGQFNAYRKALAYDPSSLSVLAGQEREAAVPIDAEEFRMNQAIQNDVINKNVSLLNDAKLKNLQLTDQQYVRQETAKSKTKETDFNVLSSISNKVAQNKLENKTIDTWRNMFPHYTFDNTMQTKKIGADGEDYLSLPGSNQTPVEKIVTRTEGNTKTTEKFVPYDNVLEAWKRKPRQKDFYDYTNYRPKGLTK